MWSRGLWIKKQEQQKSQVLARKRSKVGVENWIFWALLNSYAANLSLFFSANVPGAVACPDATTAPPNEQGSTFAAVPSGNRAVEASPESKRPRVISRQEELWPEPSVPAAKKKREATRRWYQGTEYQCQLCSSETFFESKSLLCHIRRRHNFSRQLYVSMFNRLSSSSKEESSHYYRCQVCNESLRHNEAAITRSAIDGFLHA